VKAPDEEALSRFIERFALDLTASGMPRMPARVFAGLMVTESGELTAAAIADQLQVSPASVSSAVRYLEQLDLVVRDREPGSRRDHFRVDHEVWHQMFGRRDALLVGWAERMAEGVDLVGAETDAGRRLAETRAFFEFLHGELAAVLKRWDEHLAELRASRGP
jgi:predicted transcriptional regulator